MTADPRIVKDARHLQTVTYNEICNMAYQGAKVVHPRAVEIAMHAKVPLRVRSTYSDSEGTLISAYDGATRGRDVEERPVTGIAHVSNVTQIKVLAKETAYDLQQHVFKEMANEGISVDLINISPTGVAYTVSDNVSSHAVKLLQNLGYGFNCDRTLCESIYRWGWNGRIPRGYCENRYSFSGKRYSNPAIGR